MIRFLGALLALVAFAAHGAVVPVSWVNPTQNTDGSALPASQITKSRIEYGTCNGSAFGTKAGEFSLTGNGTTANSPNLPAGMTCFRMYTTANGLESAATNVAQKLIPQAPPMPATGLTVGDPVAYEFRNNGGQLVAARVGFVDVGTVCSGESQTIAGVRYNRVETRDVDLINWPNAPKDLRLWARCV